MKIIYYSPNPALGLNDPAGYATHMKEMILAFENLGNEVLPVIMGNSDTGFIKVTRKRNGIIMHLIKQILPGIVWETVKDFFLFQQDRQFQTILEHKISGFSPDLIYERASYGQLSGILAALHHKVSHIAEVNAPLVDERINLSGRSFLSGKASRKEKFLLERTSSVALVSSELKKYFVKKYHLNGSGILVTPNAINPSDKLSDKGSIDNLKKNLGLKGETVIGFTGSLFPWHGVDLLLDAFFETEKFFPEIRLLIVGAGGIYDELRDRAKSSGIGAKIIFTGNVPHPEVSDYISLMDICVMAKSNWYGSPVKIFEYGLCGKAIIAPDTSPVKEVLSDGIEGILVGPDVSNLAAAIKKLLADPALRESMGKSFQKKVLKEYTWTRNAEAVLSNK